MDSVQKYRLADTLNHLTYPKRILVLEFCLLDNSYNLQRVSYHLETLRERRWPTERSELQMFQEWLMQLEESQHELRQIKECHIRMMEPERPSSEQSGTTARDAGIWPVFLRNFGINV
ncbi:hypothetical protein BOTNAR_0495g00010 [Botryotinia narcissicola]|uniref:Uncharacterized protein n=1 Tax=Botryotinia narcissicola TaxID=278944 RepID=A0A4Z1HTC5_9HELO|nr:hypothetical protein BOTNAR_0495g00010 [Botryotinia narcissicola]